MRYSSTTEEDADLAAGLLRHCSLIFCINSETNWVYHIAVSKTAQRWLWTALPLQLTGSGLEEVRGCEAATPAPLDNLVFKIGIVDQQPKLNTLTQRSLICLRTSHGGR